MMLETALVCCVAIICTTIVICIHINSKKYKNVTTIINHNYGTVAD